jgi:hypothetical protein
MAAGLREIGSKADPMVMGILLGRMALCIKGSIRMGKNTARAVWLQSGE